MAEKKIKDRTFRVEPLRAFDALKLQARVMKVAGSAVGRLPEIFKGVGSDDPELTAASQAAAVAAFTDIFVKNDETTVAELIKDIVETARIRRASGTYDPVDLDGDLSEENLSDIVPLAVFVLQTQFASFFGESLVNGILANRAKH